MDLSMAAIHGVHELTELPVVRQRENSSELMDRLNKITKHEEELVKQREQEAKSFHSLQAELSSV